MPRTKQDPVVIVAAKRTPIGDFQGSLKDYAAADLAGVALRAVLDTDRQLPDLVEEVVLGEVLTSGQKQAPERQAVEKAWSKDWQRPFYEVGATVIGKRCGSGMKAIMTAYDSIKAGSANFIIAGGMESMTNIPHTLTGVRQTQRMGNVSVFRHSVALGQIRSESSLLLDQMFEDGLFDYTTGEPMGAFAERTAQKLGLTRDMQDNFALETLLRARRASADGSFVAEIAPIGDVTQDEGPARLDPEKIHRLRPAFAKEGTVTAASSSRISDGAAALFLTRRSLAEKFNLVVLAEIKAHATHARAPEDFTLAPIDAIRKVHERAGWVEKNGRVKPAGLYEINEAFAVVAMAAMNAHNLPREIVNVNGGACALGHPVGASGARIVTTLLNAMKKRDEHRGVAAICIGAGEATAIALERPRGNWPLPQ